MAQRLRRLRTLTLTPEQYTRVALVALVLLAAIVLTGAAVRLSSSGLGCPDWPKCYGKPYAPLETHALIEYGNRALSGLVGLAAIAAGLLAWRRRPFRWHLALFGGLLPVGVVAQAVLGGFTVRSHLAPGFVMAHYLLSMAILDAAFALYWCSRYDRGERGWATDRLGVWSVRALVPLGQITIFAGTAATAAGPHAGGEHGDRIKRLDFRGGGTLDWVIARHGALAALLGVAAVAVWLLLRREHGERRALRPVTVLIALLGLQGIIGIVQYNAKLPAELVWVHVMTAAVTWLAVLWSVASAGRLTPAEARSRAARAPAERVPA